LALIVAGLLLHDATALGLSIAACSATPMLLRVARSRSLYRNLQGS
jgi:hypothetical protein